MTHGFCELSWRICVPTGTRWQPLVFVSIPTKAFRGGTWEYNASIILSSSISTHHFSFLRIDGKARRYNVHRRQRLCADSLGCWDGQEGSASDLLNGFRRMSSCHGSYKIQSCHITSLQYSQSEPGRWVIYMPRLPRPTFHQSLSGRLSRWPEPLWMWWALREGDWKSGSALGSLDFSVLRVSSYLFDLSFILTALTALTVNPNSSWHCRCWVFACWSSGAYWSLLALTESQEPWNKRMQETGQSHTVICHKTSQIFLTYLAYLQEFLRIGWGVSQHSRYHSMSFGVCKVRLWDPRSPANSSLILTFSVWKVLMASRFHCLQFRCFQAEVKSNST